MRKLLLLIVTAVATLAFTQSANAAITEVFDGNGDVPCTTQVGGATDGQVWCGTGSSSAGNVSSSPGVDNVPIDVNVAFPNATTYGVGPYPVVMQSHGYGGRKFPFAQMQRWLLKGYAVYSQTQRGFGYSCKDNPAAAGCASGYVHLMDFRFEIRDAQILLGRLVDENVIQPTKIATTGGSYGGGMSMSLAVLKDRVMDLDGSLHPWESPLGTDMEIAVGTPNIPWTELTYALAPNGNNLDYIKDASYFGRTGVMKESYIQGLAASGRNAPAGSDPQADILGWKALLDAGEPYDNNQAVADMKTEINTYHSSYGLPPTQAPAPLLISNGFTDDLFPADEATRFYNRSRAQFPGTPISLFFGSFGHQRGQTQANVSAAFQALEEQWVDFYLTDTGSQPPSDVTAYTQTCPNGTAGGGPYNATDWASIAPGEIRLLDANDPKRIDPDGGSFGVSAAFNPLTAGQNPCGAPDGSREFGSANYSLPKAPAGGYTVLGSTTVVAKISLPGDNSQIAARLVDVSANGQTKTLVSRGLWRPTQSGFQVFQLHANGWKVDTDHVLRLELLPRDSAQAAPGGFLSNYGRPSNNQQVATVSFVDLRIPVAESPGSLGGMVTAPAPRVLPDRPDVELAKGNEGIGSITIADYTADTDPCPAGTTGTTPPDCTPDACPVGQTGTPPNCQDKPVTGPLKMVARPTVKGKKMRVNLLCSAKYDSCTTAKVAVRAAGKVRGFKKPLLAKRGGITVKPGKTSRVYMNLTTKARKIFRDTTYRKNGRKRIRKGVRKVRANVLINGKNYGVRTVLRIGTVR
ncbi:MAG: acetylxylan esterase [Thermoleophilia bacterium]|nr:acetylxylan esterase [Thermoleophilia bacterium]